DIDAVGCGIVVGGGNCLCLVCLLFANVVAHDPTAWQAFQFAVAKVQAGIECTEVWLASSPKLCSRRSSVELGVAHRSRHIPSLVGQMYWTRGCKSTYIQHVSNIRAWTALDKH